MVVGGVNKCIKYALCAFNAAFVIIGITMVVIGVSALNGLKYLTLVESNSFGAPPKLFIAIGVIMFLIAFLGCCGACMENHSMIMAYSVLVGLVLVLQLGVGIAAFLLADDVENLAQSGLNSTLIKYHDTTVKNSEDLRKSWDLVQHELECCGVKGYKDWNASYIDPMPNKNDTLVPDSCCIGGMTANCAGAINIHNIETLNVTGIIFQEGCLSKAVAELNISRLGAVAVGLAVVEFLGVICACLLARSIRFSYETV